ncbi:uncharacterized protein [Nicotiana tomentosiformis]|uniref:uncharacterized protein n=1 Tax=Nicotiana tomentosiformis TaxID=4098 RepID=UPI00388CC7CF
MAIFTDMVETFYEVFMDDFLVFRPSFDECLTNLSKVLARLLEKDTPLKFDEHWLKEYEELKKRLVIAPIITAPEWENLLKFDVETKDKKGTENQVADHLTRLETRAHFDERDKIQKLFPDEQLLPITAGTTAWYADYVNFIVSGVTTSKLSPGGKRKFMHDIRFYLWDEPFLFKNYVVQLVRRCVPEDEMEAILHDCHASPYGENLGGDKTAAKLSQSGFYWPTMFKDAHAFVKRCDRCQRTSIISRSHKMPLKSILEVEAVAFLMNDAKVVVIFVKKNIFMRFGTPRALISDGGTHFCNKLLGNLLAKYGMRHKVAPAYHTQISGQVEVSNSEVKQNFREDSECRLVYGKACHLSIELENKSYWVIKKLNFGMDLAGEKWMLQLNELEEFRLHAYENAELYKEKTKRWHDKHILHR